MVEIKHRLTAINHRNINLLLGIGLLCTTAVRVMSIIREGGTPLSLKFFTLTGLIGVLAAIYLFRNKLRLVTKVYTLVAILFFYFTVGVFNRALLSNSATFLVFGPLFLSFLIDFRTNLRIVALLLIIFFLIGIYTVQTGELRVEAEAFFNNRWNWIIDTSIIFTAALSILLLHQRSLSELREIHENLHRQNTTLRDHAQELAMHQAELEIQVRIRSKELRKANSSLSASNLMVAEKNLEIAWQNEEMERNVEEIRRVELELIESDKLASIGVFASGISQNITTPLRIMQEEYETIGRLIAAEPASKKDKLDELSKIFLTGMERIERIIRDLRHVNDSAPGEQCDLNSLIRSSTEAIRYLTGSQIKVNLPTGSSGLNVLGNPTRLERIITNLLTNACHALEKCKDPKIRIGVSDQPHWTILCVEDKGMGISEENMKRVKDPFFTTKEPGRGTGLGLFLCQSLMQDIGGKLEIESEVGKGTKVMLHFRKPSSVEGKSS